MYDYDRCNTNASKMAGVGLKAGMGFGSSYNHAFDRKRIEVQIEYARIGVRSAELELEEYDDRINALQSGMVSLDGDLNWRAIRRERLLLSIETAKNEVRRIEIDLKEFDYHNTPASQGDWEKSKEK